MGHFGSACAVLTFLILLLCISKSSSAPRGGNRCACDVSELEAERRTRRRIVREKDARIAQLEKKLEEFASFDQNCFSPSAFPVDARERSHPIPFYLSIPSSVRNVMYRVSNFSSLCELVERAPRDNQTNVTLFIEKNITFLDQVVVSSGQRIYFIGDSATVVLNGQNNTNLFNISFGATVSFQSLTFREGYIGPSPYGDRDSKGAAIFNGGIAVIRECRFINNSASGGGAIYNKHIILKIDRCMFSNNSDQAIYNHGSIKSIQYCEFFKKQRVVHWDHQ